MAIPNLIKHPSQQIEPKLWNDINGSGTESRIPKRTIRIREEGFKYDVSETSIVFRSRRVNFDNSISHQYTLLSRKRLLEELSCVSLQVWNEVLITHGIHLCVDQRRVSGNGAGLLGGLCSTL